MTTGSASGEIGRDPVTVFAAVADITRMGERSPESIAARWVGGATTLKKWTTTFEVTESYEYTASTGAQRFLYDVVMRRNAEMVKDMQRTLERIKQSVEAS